jgi:PAS domain S-box-containing protein
MTQTPIRLLLLEDKPGDSRLVQEALAEQAPGEFAVTTCGRLADAQARIQTERFDAVLCDLDLPDSTGIDAAKAIIAASPETALVVLTPSHDLGLGRAAIELGAYDYLHKGALVPLLIVRTLRYAVERKRILANLRAASSAPHIRVAERTADLEVASRSLRVSEARYRHLFAETSLVTLLIDPADGCIVEANHAAAAYYGWDVARLQSMNIGDINIRGAEALHPELEQAHTRRKLHSGFHHRLASGEVRDVEVYSSPVSAVGEGGGPLLHSIVIDVTERQQAEAALRQQGDELRQQNAELERFNQVSVDRELDMIGLKRNVNALSLELGRAAPFNLDFVDAPLGPPVPIGKAKDSTPPAVPAQ